MSGFSTTSRPPALLLAGGQARRMGGGDKCLRHLAGRPILDHVIARLRPQVASFILNANGDPARFGGYSLPIVSDEIGRQAGLLAGPLAGILAGLDWAAAEMLPASHVLSVSTDCPFLPADLVSRLMQAVANGGEIAIAASNGRKHPVIGLWPVALRAKLRHALVVENLRKVEAFCDRYRTLAVDFPDAVNLSGGGIDPFFNANTPEDLALANRLLASPSPH